MQGAVTPPHLLPLRDIEKGSLRLMRKRRMEALNSCLTGFDIAFSAPSKSSQKESHSPLSTETKYGYEPHKRAEYGYEPHRKKRDKEVCNNYEV